jgi:predicted nucleic acid-binding protein
MEPALLGIVLDSSILIAAERRKMTPDQAIETVQKTVGEVPIVLCSVTVAESDMASIGPTHLKLAAAAENSWMN